MPLPSHSHEGEESQTHKKSFLFPPASAVLLSTTMTSFQRQHPASLLTPRSLTPPSGWQPRCVRQHSPLSYLFTSSLSRLLQSHILELFWHHSNSSGRSLLPESTTCPTVSSQLSVGTLHIIN